MLVTLHLGGFLGEKYGLEHKFHVSRAVDAVRGLACQVYGFKQDVLDYRPGFHLIVGDEALSEDKLNQKAHSEDVYLVPAVGGGKSPIVQIIVGAALIYLTAGGASGYVGTWVTGMGVSATTAGYVAAVGFAIGASMVLGGVARMLYTPPRVDGPAERPENKPSYVFNGPVNAEAQGHPIPLLYGLVRCGSIVASAGIETVDMIEATGGDGGGGWDDWGDDGGGGWIDKNL